MRAYKLLLWLAISFFLFAGCGENEVKTQEAALKPVAVTKLTEASHPILLDYVGTVQSKDLKRYSFKVAGKVEKVFVEEGQRIQEGDSIALLEKEDLHFSLEAAQKMMEAAKAQYDQAVKGAKSEEIRSRELDVNKANEYYVFVKDTYEKVKTLYDEGAVAENAFKEAKLKLDQAEDSLKQAQSALKLTKDGAGEEEIKGLYKQYEAAKVGYEAQKKLVEDSLITADCSGYVLKVLSKENEMVGAGIPVVTVSSDEYEVNIGLTQEDISKIESGDAAKVYINDQEIEGTVAIIGKIPDSESRTYTTGIRLNDNPSGINIGAIAKVEITADLKKGVWVPIKYILNDGEDYVFVFEKGRAKRQNVKIGQLLEGIVCVEGLKPGEILITEGIKSIKDGHKVKIAESTIGSVE